MKQDTHMHIPPYGHQVHDMTNDHDTYFVLFKCHKDLKGNSAGADRPIKQLAYELDSLRGTHRDWAEDVQMELQDTTEGEYT